MSARVRRAAVLTVSWGLLLAQSVDVIWPRADERSASPASVVAAICLFALLALYPTGRFVPWWTAPIALLGVLAFVAAAIVGPDAAAAVYWPLPIAPLLLALVIGGQGYRYVRRSDVDERAAVRWPLLGLIVLLSVVVPADAISLLITGHPVQSSGPIAGGIIGVAFLLPAAGFVVGLSRRAADVVDRAIAGWMSILVGGAILGSLFAAVFLVAGSVAPSPWPAWAGAAAVALAAVGVAPLARSAGSWIVFRGRRPLTDALRLLTRRIGSAVDPEDIPVQVVGAIQDAIGSSSVVLRRWGQSAAWVQTTGAGEESHVYEATVEHLGLPIATVAVAPRPAEGSLDRRDKEIVDALAAASAPALHSARLASSFPELTERERQVLSGIVRGLPNAVIADRLGVSSKTIANHVSIVLTKLRVPDRERAAELARRRSAEA